MRLEGEVEELESEVAEKLARIQRLHRQLRLLKAKGGRLTTQGFETLEAMEEAERREEKPRHEGH